MKRARNQTKKFTLDVKGMGAALRGMGATALLSPITAIGAGIAGVGAAFMKAVRSNEEFNRAMRNSQAIMGDLSQTIDTDMRKAAFDAARITHFSATEAAKAYFFLASAGLDATRSIKAMPAVSRFAQAGMFDMARATELLTDAQSALGLSTEDASRHMTNMVHVSDVLVRANTLANASVEQFSEALTTKAAASMKIVGMEIEKGVAVLAAFADQGRKGAEAGTAFHIVLRDMQTKALDNAEAFERFNIAVFDTRGELRDMPLILSDIERALAGASDATKKLTLKTLGFQDRSVSYLQSLIGMSTQIQAYTDALFAAGGATAEVADKQLTPFQKGWARLTATLGEATQAMHVVTDTLGESMEGTAKAIEDVGWSWKQFKEDIRSLWLGDMARVLDSTVAMERELEHVLADRTKTTDALTASTADLGKESKGVTDILGKLADELDRVGLVGHDLTLLKLEGLGPKPESMQRAMKLVELLKRAGDEGTMADIIGNLTDELERFGKTGREIALFDLGQLGADPATMDVARGLVEALESQTAAKELDDITSGLEREREALMSTARELDLLEAGWRNAAEAELAYINLLHDDIDAERERATLDRQAQAAAARDARMADRITKFAEVDLSRTMVSGLSGGRGRKQQVTDVEAVAVLNRIERKLDTPRNAYALMGP